MKLKLQREPFWHSFQLAAAVAPSRSPKPILQNIKIECDEQGTVLSATDTEVGIRIQIDDVEVESAGAAVISVARLSAILKESRDEQLSLDADSEKTKIKGKHSRFELQGQNPDEFPVVEGFESSEYVEVGAEGLRSLIRRTLFATDAESSRYALGGVLLEVDKETMVSVGTDGRRLAKMECSGVKVEGNPFSGGTTIVPAKSMHVMERLLQGGDAPVQLATRQNDLVIKRAGTVFSTRLVEGRFPKWKDVIPSREDSRKIVIPVAELFPALRQAAIVASEESRGVDFTFKQGSLVLETKTAEVGNTRIEMPVDYDGDDLSITLDHRFVADFLKVLDPDQSFTMDLENGESAAFCFTEDHFGYVIMPLSRERG